MATNGQMFTGIRHNPNGAAPVQESIREQLKSFRYRVAASKSVPWATVRGADTNKMQSNPPNLEDIKGLTMAIIDCQPSQQESPSDMLHLVKALQVTLQFSLHSQQCLKDELSRTRNQLRDAEKHNVASATAHAVELGHAKASSEATVSTIEKQFKEALDEANTLRADVLSLKAKVQQLEQDKALADESLRLAQQKLLLPGASASGPNKKLAFPNTPTSGPMNQQPTVASILAAPMPGGSGGQHRSNSNPIPLARPKSSDPITPSRGSSNDAWLRGSQPPRLASPARHSRHRRQSSHGFPDDQDTSSNDSSQMCGRCIRKGRSYCRHIAAPHHNNGGKEHRCGNGGIDTNTLALLLAATAGRGLPPQAVEQLVPQQQQSNKPSPDEDNAILRKLECLSLDQRAAVEEQRIQNQVVEDQLREAREKQEADGVALARAFTESRDTVARDVQRIQASVEDSRADARESSRRLQNAVDDLADRQNRLERSVQQQSTRTAAVEGEVQQAIRLASTERYQKQTMPEAESKPLTPEPKAVVVPQPSAATPPLLTEPSVNKEPSKKVPELVEKFEKESTPVPEQKSLGTKDTTTPMNAAAVPADEEKPIRGSAIGNKAPSASTTPGQQRSAAVTPVQQKPSPAPTLVPEASKPAPVPAPESSKNVSQRATPVPNSGMATPLSVLAQAPGSPRPEADETNTSFGSVPEEGIATPSVIQHGTNKPSHRVNARYNDSATSEDEDDGGERAPPPLPLTVSAQTTSAVLRSRDDWSAFTSANTSPNRTEKDGGASAVKSPPAAKDASPKAEPEDKPVEKPAPQEASKKDDDVAPPAAAEKKPPLPKALQLEDESDDDNQKKKTTPEEKTERKRPDEIQVATPTSVDGMNRSSSRGEFEGLTSSRKSADESRRQLEALLALDAAEEMKKRASAKAEGAEEKQEDA